MAEANVIATLKDDFGRTATFALPEDITIPPIYLLRGGKLWSMQPDWQVVPTGQPIRATYRNLNRTRALDISELEPTATQKETAAQTEPEPAGEPPF